MAVFGVERSEFQRLRQLWQSYHSRYGLQAWRHISGLFDEFKPGFFLRKSQQGKNAQQAWNNFKGKALEELLKLIIQEQVQSIGLKCVLGSQLTGPNLSPEESVIHQRVSVRFGPYRILPDPDLVVYTPDLQVVAVISSKTSLRERVAQVAFWKRKLREDHVTAHIKALFATLDEDKDLEKPLPDPSNYRDGFKNRILVEHELDCTYVLTDSDIPESQRVKLFDKFLDDLQAIVKRR